MCPSFLSSFLDFTFSYLILSLHHHLLRFSLYIAGTRLHHTSPTPSRHTQPLYSLSLPSPLLLPLPLTGWLTNQPSSLSSSFTITLVLLFQWHCRQDIFNSKSRHRILRKVSHCLRSPSSSPRVHRGCHTWHLTSARYPFIYLAFQPYIYPFIDLLVQLSILVTIFSMYLSICLSFYPLIVLPALDHASLHMHLNTCLKIETANLLPFFSLSIIVFIQGFVVIMIGNVPQVRPHSPLHPPTSSSLILLWHFYLLHVLLHTHRASAYRIESDVT